MISFSIERGWKYTPDKINPENMKNIVNAGPQFHIRAAIQRLKITSGLKVKSHIFLTQAPPQNLCCPELPEF